MPLKLWPWGRDRAARSQFAYLFEKFPSFSQTFCIREVEALLARDVPLKVYSIREPAGEPTQSLREPPTGKPVYLPAKYDEFLANDATFRRASRKALEDLRVLWGDETEKRRVYEALWLGPVLERENIGHVHVHFAGLGARTAFWLNRLFGVNYSVTAHANDIFRDEPPERLRQIFRAARVVVTVSDFSVRFLQEHYPESKEKFRRVYNGIRTKAFPLSTFPEGKPLIVSVGRYIEKKGFLDLIEACAALKDLEFECQIVGHGPQEAELQAAISRLGVEGKVVLAGPRTEEEIKHLLARAHLFALPCVTAADGAMDNLPTVIMEAMAAGLPVLSTSLAAIPEMVADGETGFVVPERQPALLAERLGTLLGDPLLARRMGERGHERCLELFDWERTSANLCDILSSHGAIPRFSTEFRAR